MPHPKPSGSGQVGRQRMLLVRYYINFWGRSKTRSRCWCFSSRGQSGDFPTGIISRERQMCFPKTALAWSRPQLPSERRGAASCPSHLLSERSQQQRPPLPRPILQAGALLGGYFNIGLEPPLMCHFLFEMQCLTHLILITFGKLLFSLSDRDVRGVEFIFERGRFEVFLFLKHKCFFDQNVK